MMDYSHHWNVLISDNLFVSGGSSLLCVWSLLSSLLYIKFVEQLIQLFLEILFFLIFL